MFVPVKLDLLEMAKPVRVREYETNQSFSPFLNVRMNAAGLFFVCEMVDTHETDKQTTNKQTYKQTNKQTNIYVFDINAKSKNL